MTIQIFNAALTGAFQPSAPVTLLGERFTIDWSIIVAAGGAAVAAKVQWYLEFATDDPNAAGTEWFREVAEEDTAGGDTAMPKVIRHFEENGGADLAVGTTHSMSTQLVRAHNFARCQVKLAAGNPTTVRAFARFGLAAISPA